MEVHEGYLNHWLISTQVVEAEELRVMVQGDEAPLDWAALQDVCAYEGFGEAVGGADEASTPEGGDESPGGATEGASAAADGGADAAADGTDADAAAAARRARNPRDVPVVKALWAAVAAFDETLQRDFLMFVTGSKTAPMGGLGALRPPAHASFKVQRAGPDSDALPTSHTCFNTLLLPEYDPPQKVAKLLEYAVREGHEGFALE